ncbi:MAG TPA: D-glucuronyl C5-epimerase family protein [Candidatus Angelobacter sp.]|nr:D-glucuronyl C5-epimerase family protein [Candidatus Angelobacter sp.]
MKGLGPLPGQVSASVKLFRRKKLQLTAQSAAPRSRLRYYRRVFSAYLGRGTSQLTFWHERPEVNAHFRPGNLGEYYMTFLCKADYQGPVDSRGIPLLDYRGALGRQYNPIAIAQFGLGNYNYYVRSKDAGRKQKFLMVADWLRDRLVANPNSIPVWMHNFDWEYRDTLKSPWYSGLAQGQGISVLVRAYAETGQREYLDAATRASQAFHVDVKAGGVACRDENNNLWIEEYVVSPPTHILNGFLWASWGIYDYLLATGDSRMQELFKTIVETLRNRLACFDTGFWSLYEQSGTKLRMIASPFYHALHIVQLEVMHKITGEPFFAEFAERWRCYQTNWFKRNRALAHKAAFKLLYY